MKYLVTGGAGFIGSHLVEALIVAGHEVHILDNLSTGKKENIPSAAVFIQGDITDLESIRAAFVGIDGVFHCAADPRLPYSIQCPKETTQTNLEGTLNVLIAARDAKVSRVVCSSSASVYGDQMVSPQRIDLVPMPMSPYGLQKFAGEHFARLFAELYGLETVSLRYFNVYGPRMSSVGAYVPVFTIFLKQRAEGKPLTIFGDGNQARDFVHVTDIVQANMNAMTSPNVGKGEVFNVGVGEETTVNDVAKRIGGEVVYLPARPGDIRRSCADISLTRDCLGYEPKVHFQDGLKAFLGELGLGVDHS